jgi:hypothetical protein
LHETAEAGFCQSPCQLGVEDWKDVMFSDESHFELQEARRC